MRSPFRLNKYSICWIVCGIFGLCCLVAGIVLICIADSIIRSQVVSQVALKNGSLATNLWLNPPYSISMQFWMFNVTNAETGVKTGQTPVLTEKGPYSYKESQEKFNYTFDDNQHTVRYQNSKTYYFDPSTSCSTCKETDMVTVLNVPYLVVVNLVRLSAPKLTNDTGLSSKILFTILDAVLDLVFHEHLFTTATVGQLLFDGYQDNIFQLVTCIQKYNSHPVTMFFKCIWPYLRPKYTQLSVHQLASLAPEELKDAFLPSYEWFKLGDDSVPDRMGFFFGKNGTDDGQYLIEDGSTNISRVGDIITWKGEKQLSWWNPTPHINEFGQLANMINGSDGTIFPPYIQRNDVLRMYISDICRSVYVTYKEDTSVKGIPGYRFHLPPEVFDADRWENIGFCLPQTDGYYGNDTADDPIVQKHGCLPSGLLNVTTCQLTFNGVSVAPVVMSAPHFLFTPKYVQTSISGISSPDESLYGTVVDVEPSATIDDNTAAKLRKDLLIPQLVLKIMSYVLTALGAFLLAVLGLILGIALYRRREKDDDQLVIDNPNYGVIGDE